MVLHGGPGSGCTPGHRRLFAPDRYRLVLFDQRGCGRSTPDAGDVTTDLSTNTTHHLIADLERLRAHLAIERWLVFGNSWGSTLALAYAEALPDRVLALVLAAVTTTTANEIDWLYRGLRKFLPEEWVRFRDGVSHAVDDGELVEAYRELLADPDPSVREAAASRWCAWEDAVVAASHASGPDPRYRDPRFRLTFARLVTHYFAHRAWLADGALLHGASRLNGIPGAMIHGRVDLASPLHTAWKLHAAWPESELVVVETGGHSIGQHGMASAVVAATDRFATLT